MREIKFRAWDKEKEEMLFNGKEYELRCLGEPSKDINWIPIISPHANTDRFELQQYTGLHDKNGNEIYEGDILQTIVDHTRTDVFLSKFEVYWDTYMARFRKRRDDGTLFNFYAGAEAFKEVIGNIYENPELSEEVKE